MRAMRRSGALLIAVLWGAVSREISALAIVGLGLVASGWGTLRAAEPKQGRPPPDYGPFVAHSVTFQEPKNKDGVTWEGAVPRAMHIWLDGERAGDEKAGDAKVGGTTLCYDAERMALCAWWHGAFLDFSKTHYTSYKGSLPPQPAAPPAYLNLHDPGWLLAGEPATPRLLWRQVDGPTVTLAYAVGPREILERPLAAQGRLVGRAFRIGAGPALTLIVAGLAEGQAQADSAAGQIRSGSAHLAAALRGDAAGTLRAEGTRLALDLPASEQSRTFHLWLAAGNGAALDAVQKQAAGPVIDPEENLKAPTKQQFREFLTAGVLGGDAQAYTTDEFTLPPEPYGMWLRVSGLDALPDGRLAVCTLNGDVWTVAWEHEDLRELRWRRIASGLYEPLGLKVADGQIYVRGRDCITRLLDQNGDGLAERYEHFHSAGPIGPGYHAFLFDLVTDRAGNFYYSVSGRKAPGIGSVVKVQPDGKAWETVATCFRHPNGLGAGGPRDWVLVADNPDGKFPSGASIVRPGRRYGENGPRTEPMLYVLPPQVDTSSGSQTWADPKRWGPLSGAIVHTAYSTSLVSYVLVQDDMQLPNAFAVASPLKFRSGPMRLCVRPQDGQVYVGGQRGWDSNAAADGCVTRIRYTGKPGCLVRAARADREGIRLTFSSPLDPKSVSDDAFFAERVGKGKKELEVEEVRLLDDSTVLIVIAANDLEPKGLTLGRDPATGDTVYAVLDPIGVSFNLKSRDGAGVKDTVWATINSLAPAK